MKSNKYHGWQQVFRFSFREGFKEKSYKILLIIICAILLFLTPVKTFIKKSGEKKDAKSKITSVMVYDESGLSIDYSQALKDSRYEKVKVNASPEVGYEEQIKRLEKSKDSTEIIVRIVFNPGGQFEMLVVKAADTALSKSDIEKMSDDFKDYFCKEKLQCINMTKEQEEFINQSVESKVRFVAENGDVKAEEEQGDAMTSDQYGILMAGLMVCTILISFCGGSIATAIVTEKSSKVIEYLIINVKPMALLIGKILATLSLVLIQVLAMGISYVLSSVINKAIWGDEVESIIDMLKSITDTMVGLTPANALLALLMLLVGVLFFCIIAGLAGASVSKLEEIGEGMKLFQMFMLVGCYLCIGLGIAEMMGHVNPVFHTTCVLLPISSPFLVPISLLMGKTSLLMGGISFIILLAVVVLLFSFTAKVYESMILYQGKTLKLKEILQIAKNTSTAGKEEA